MNRYFVTSIGGNLTCTRMEDELRAFARREFEHVLISEERVGTMVQRLEFYQDEFHKANPRVKKLEIRNWYIGIEKKFRHICFGTTTISLTLVGGEIL